MKYLMLIIAALLIVGCGGAQNVESLVKVGSQAPEFQAKDQSGKTVTLGELHRDGPVIVTFLRSFY